MDYLRIQQGLRESGELKLKLAQTLGPTLYQVAQAIAATLQRGGKVLLFGNGGSSSDAQHIAAEFVGRFRSERLPLPALALGCNTAELTAIANDYGYAEVFARAIRALGRPGDVAIGISTSGKSPNVLQGIRAARELRLVTVGLCGQSGPLAEAVELALQVPSSDTARIQECHIAMAHQICKCVDELLALQPALPARTQAGKQYEWAELLAARAEWRRRGQVVVWTNGCFDLLHVGHVRNLRQARSLGDVLVVGMNSDESVRKLKGDGRPVVCEADRVEIISALACVDAVTVFGDPTPERLLRELQPEVHCKGADYAAVPPARIPEAEVVRSYGGRVEFLPLSGEHSTSSLIRRIRQAAAGARE